MNNFFKKIEWKFLLGVFKLKRIVGNIFSTRRLDFSDKDIYIQTNTLREYVTRAYSCKKEPETCAWLLQHAKEDVVFYDIGANIGAYALIAGSLGAQVYAFEPSPENYATLHGNVRKNSLADTVTPLPLVLSKENTIASFAADEYTSGATAGFSLENNKKGNHVCLPALTLDDCVRVFNLPKPNMIKIDVDGAEGEVLSGAKKLLGDTNLTHALIEVEEDTKKLVDETMEKLGFKKEDSFKRGAKGVENNIYVRV